MKFPEIDYEVEKMLKLRHDQKLTFQIAPTRPVETKEHMFRKDDKMVIEPCTGKCCDYCATARTLMKNGMEQEARQFFAKTRYHLPVNVEKNRHNIEPGEYVFRFGNIIRDAYMQLICENRKYHFDPSKSALNFTHKVSMKGEWPDYRTCFFTIGKGKRQYTVAELCAAL
jgi:hypothetical protein